MSGAGPKVLLADDDPGVRSTTAEILRNAGYDVDEAEDGLVALEIIRDRTVSVLVLDISMPRCDGIEVLDALDRPPVTVIASAFGVEPDVRARLGDKVFTYLKKPVHPADLIEVVERALASTGHGGRHDTGTGNGNGLH
jgi:two-component system chemotaxis response regulator CheY